MRSIFIDNKKIGVMYEALGARVFFGTRLTTPELLEEAFPYWNFHYLEQVHSDFIVEASSATPQGDGHWTQKSEEALVIRTADCMPLFIVDGRKIMAIHAGWKGLNLGIIFKGLTEYEWDEPRAFVGPHIRRENFEVNLDVANQLLLAYKRFGGEEEILFPHNNPEKSYVDLSELARAQLLSGRVGHWGVQSAKEDTFSDLAYQSYRRDGDDAGRQLSFVVKI